MMEFGLNLIKEEFKTKSDKKSRVFQYLIHLHLSPGAKMVHRASN